MNGLRGKHLSEISFVPTKEDLRDELTEKWSATGFLDGLRGRTNNISTLFEINYNQILNDEWFKEPNVFESITFPIIRNVGIRMVSTDIIAMGNYEELE